MAYVTPPTYTDDTTLSAADLNKNSGNQEYLKGVLDAPNVPFASIETPSAGVDAPTTNYWFRHTHDYFHWYFYLTSATIDRTRIRIYSEDGSLQFGAALIDDTSTPANQAAALLLDPSYRDSYDVSALTVGTWYRAEVTIEASGSGLETLIYLEERTTA